MKNKSVLLFDLDGTLSDPRAGMVACTQYALTALGRAPPKDEEIASFIGPPLRRMFSTLLGAGDDALIERAVSLFRERYTRHGIYEARLYDGIEALLEALHPAFSAMFVVTSKPTAFATRIVEHFAIDHRFRAVHGTELNGRFDDKAELIRHALTTEQVRASDSLMIGDRAADVVAAAANGIPTIGVLWGYGSARELDEAGAGTLCATPNELADYLSGLDLEGNARAIDLREDVGVGEPA